MDNLPELALSGRGMAVSASYPVAPEPPGLDPDEPDNASTLFYQPGAATPMEIPEAPGSQGFNDGQPRRPMTLPLDAARAAGATFDLPPAPPQPTSPGPSFSSQLPTMPSSHLSQISADAQSQEPDRSRPAPPRRGGTGLLFLIVTVTLLLAVTGAAVLFLNR